MRGHETRTLISVVLAVAMAAAAIAGGSCLYLRGQLLSRGPFVNRTVAALDRAPVRRVVARELVVQVIDRASPDLLAARPVLNSVVEGVVGTQEFRGVVRAVAGQAHRLLFDRGTGSVVFSVADAGAVVISALRTLAPDLAAKIPPSLDATLLDLRKQSFAVRTLRAADKVRLLAVVLPLLALLLLLGSVGVARRRRAAVTRCGLALAVAAIALWADLGLLRHSVLVNLFGSEELSDGDVRAAAGALWDAYMGDLATWMLALAAFGAVLAGVASGRAATADPRRAPRSAARPAVAAAKQPRATRGGAARAARGKRAARPPDARARRARGGVRRGLDLLRDRRAALGRGSRARERAAHAARQPCLDRLGGRVAGGARGRRSDRARRRRATALARGRRLACAHVQRLRAALRRAPGSGRLRGHPQLDVGRRIAGLADRQPGTGDRPPAGRRHPRLQDLHALRPRQLARPHPTDIEAEGNAAQSRLGEARRAGARGAAALQRLGGLRQGREGQAGGVALPHALRAGSDEHGELPRHGAPLPREQPRRGARLLR